MDYHLQPQKPRWLARHTRHTQVSTSPELILSRPDHPATHVYKPVLVPTHWLTASQNVTHMYPRQMWPMVLLVWPQAGMAYQMEIASSNPLLSPSIPMVVTIRPARWALTLLAIHRRGFTSPLDLQPALR